MKYKILNLLSYINKDAILVFGNQKSGTTAVARLLSIRTGITSTIDTKALWEPSLNYLINHPEKLNSHVKKHSYSFSKDLIKEPNLLYFRKEIEEIFTNKTHILIVRDPIKNIKSILNRLNLPGDSKEIDLEKVPYLWRHIFKNHEGHNYIEKLCNRWNQFYDHDNFQKDKYTIVKYEDFLQDKISFIDNLTSMYNLPRKNDISEYVDIQFQPKGLALSVEAFFGEENLKLIQMKCSKVMAQYNYKT